MSWRLAILSLAILAGCASSPSGPEAQATPEPASAPSQEPQPKVTSKEDDRVQLGKTTLRTKKGQLWELDASRVDWYEGRRKARAYDVDWDLLDEKRRPAVNVKAPEADIDMETEQVEFVGQTVATRTAVGDLLKVNRLIWDGQARMFYGSKGVRWIKGVSTVVGNQATATAELDKVKLEGNVRARTLFNDRSNEDKQQ